MNWWFHIEDLIAVHDIIISNILPATTNSTRPVYLAAVVRLPSIQLATSQRYTDVKWH